MGQNVGGVTHADTSENDYPIFFQFYQIFHFVIKFEITMDYLHFKK